MISSTSVNSDLRSQAFEAHVVVEELNWHGRMAGWRAMGIRANIKCQNMLIMNNWSMPKDYWVSSVTRRQSVRVDIRGSSEKYISIRNGQKLFDMHV
jgi:hypothetical protein